MPRGDTRREFPSPWNALYVSPTDDCRGNMARGVTWRDALALGMPYIESFETNLALLRIVGETCPGGIPGGNALAPLETRLALLRIVGKHAQRGYPESRGNARGPLQTGLGL